MQLQFKRSLGHTREASSISLGISADKCQPALQSEAFKELVNKLAWALGSSYAMPYNNIRTVARLAAVEIATAVILAHGYPRSISYPGVP